MSLCPLCLSILFVNWLNNQLKTYGIRKIGKVASCLPGWPRVLKLLLVGMFWLYLALCTVKWSTWLICSDFICLCTRLFGVCVWLFGVFYILATTPIYEEQGEPSKNRNKQTYKMHPKTETNEQKKRHVFDSISNLFECQLTEEPRSMKYKFGRLQLAWLALSDIANQVKHFY